MISGQTIKGVLNSKIDDIERSLADAKNLLYTEQKSIKTLENDRDEAYIRIAQIYLPELSAETIKNTLMEKRSEVKQIYDSRERQKSQLDSEIKNISEKISSIDQRINGIIDGEKKLESEKERLTKTTIQFLHNNEEYQKILEDSKILSERLDENKYTMELYENKYADIKKALMNEKFFNYLSTKKFGTEEYSSGFIAKIFDPLIAKFAHFIENKEIYNKLENRIKAMKQEFDVRTKIYELMHDKIDILEQKAKKQTGLDIAILREENNEAEKIKSLDEKKDLEEYKLNISNQRNTLNTDRGEHYTQALNSIKDYLDDLSMTLLIDISLRTPSNEDDNLVHKISDIGESIKMKQNNIVQYSKTVDTLENFLGTIKSIYTEFIRLKYNHERSTFNTPIDMPRMLNDFYLGNMTKEKIFYELKKHHHMEPEPTYDTYDYNRDNYQRSRNSNSSSSSRSSYSSPSWSSSSSRSSYSSPSRSSSIRTSSSIGGGSGIRTSRKF